MRNLYNLLIQNYRWQTIVKGFILKLLAQANACKIINIFK